MKREDLLIKELNLQAHPEGGFYKETYRSEGVVLEEHLPENFDGSRNYCTSIYFLLKTNEFSAFHRINQDENWYFHEGSSLTIHQISPDGIYTKTVLGSNILEGEVFQHTVPKNYWFGATVNQPDSYSLVGCSVSPGFDFKDFELANSTQLQKKFPDHKIIIEELTR